MLVRCCDCGRRLFDDPLADSNYVTRCTSWRMWCQEDSGGWDPNPTVYARNIIERYRSGIETDWALIDNLDGDMLREICKLFLDPPTPTICTEHTWDEWEFCVNPAGPYMRRLCWTCKVEERKEYPKEPSRTMGVLDSVIDHDCGNDFA